jgi:hypothetical protein
LHGNIIRTPCIIRGYNDDDVDLNEIRRYYHHHDGVNVKYSPVNNLPSYTKNNNSIIIENKSRIYMEMIKY